jgi:poly(3-hydroxybutyrate) depolymerase
MGVCQPSVPIMVATALMSEECSQLLPKTITLIGGPIDTRHSPTEVNLFAHRRRMSWFENNLITRVPINYRGYMRAVYPGFMQLSGFMAMNMQMHIGEHIKLFNNLVEGDEESVEAHEKFYDEYLAVLDMPAEFYLQTIKIVFKDHELPKGTLMYHGRNVYLDAISKPALLVVEGEKDDITGLGQTKAALNLCRNIPASRKKYHLQKGVGHYGSFNGRKFRNSILPIIRDFCYKFDKG